MCRILDTYALSVSHRHFDRMQFEESGQSVPNSPLPSASNSHSVVAADAKKNSTEIRRSVRLQQKPKTDHENPDSYLKWVE